MEQSKKNEPIYDNDGKELKLSLQTFCQGILFLAGVFGLAVCASMRGCQEYRKHHPKPQMIEKATTNSVTNIVTDVFQKTR